MPSKLQLATAIARAKATALKRSKEATEEALVTKVSKRIPPPVSVAGKDGRDAPQLHEILEALKPLLPTPVIEQTSNTIVQKLDTGELTDIVEAMVNSKLPKMDKELRPKVELIREDVSDEKLEGFVSKEAFDKALKRIQDAITYNSSGGGGTPEVGPLANIILADEATNIVLESDLDLTKINIVHATVASSTVQLPKASPNYIVWVEDAVVGGGNLTITRAS